MLEFLIVRVWYVGKTPFVAKTRAADRYKACVCVCVRLSVRTLPSPAAHGTSSLTDPQHRSAQRDSRATQNYLDDVAKHWRTWKPTPMCLLKPPQEYPRTSTNQNSPSATNMEDLAPQFCTLDPPPGRQYSDSGGGGGNLIL